MRVIKLCLKIYGRCVVDSNQLDESKNLFAETLLAGQSIAAFIPLITNGKRSQITNVLWELALTTKGHCQISEPTKKKGGGK